MQEEIKQLEKQITELEFFKSNLEKQQLNYPIDKLSADILFKDVITKANFDIIPYSLGTYDESTTISINGKKFLLDTTQFIEFAG